jgi:hypothetical protein
MSKLCKEGRFCSKKGQSGHQMVKYICLEASCGLDRVLCEKCVHEGHRKHKVGIIDKLIEPLNRLGMNSGCENSESDFLYLQDKLKEVCDVSIVPFRSGKSSTTSSSTTSGNSRTDSSSSSTPS